MWTTGSLKYTHCRCQVLRFVYRNERSRKNRASVSGSVRHLRRTQRAYQTSGKNHMKIHDFINNKNVVSLKTKDSASTSHFTLNFLYEFPKHFRRRNEWWESYVCRYVSSSKNSKECVSICYYSYTLKLNFISALSEQLYYARPRINTIIHPMSENIVKNTHKALINMDSFHMAYASLRILEGNIKCRVDLCNMASKF